MGKTTDFEKERKKYTLRKTIRRVFAVVFIAIFGIAVYALRFDIAAHGFGVLLSDTMALLVDHTGYPVEIDSQPVSLTSVGRRAVLVTGNALSVYNAAGNRVIHNRIAGTNTHAQSAGRYLLTYVRGGYDLQVRSGETVVFAHRFDFPIHTATVAPNGAIAVSTSAVGDQSLVTVFDANYTQQFMWVSSERIIYRLSLDATAEHLAVGGVGLVGGALDSLVTVFEVATGNEYGSQGLNDALLLSLDLLEDGEVTAVTDRGVHRISVKTKKERSYSFEEENLTAFVVAEDGSTTLALGDYDQGHVLTLVRLDTDAQPLARTKFNRNIKSLHIYEEDILAFLGDRAVRFSPTLERMGITETPEAIHAQVISNKLYYATMQQINRATIR